MNILFISESDAEYQSDVLFHGLKSLPDLNIVDIPRMDHMYAGCRTPPYGNGFTLYNLLQDGPVDRTDIPGKIANGFFDLVIVAGGYCYRNLPFPFMDKVFKHMPPGRIMFIDGGDEQAISTYATKGIYFKRENTGTGIPISFAIPEVKMACGFWPRERTEAAYRPGMSYMYEREDDYYTGYRTSSFAHTSKKAGWDCLRHYEIMSTGCIPIFDIEGMPEQTCISLPKDALRRVLREHASMSADDIAMVGKQFFEWCKTYCTTEALATYVLSHAAAGAGVPA